MEKVRVGIIGTGGIARTHLSNVKKIEPAELICGCDVNESIVNQRAKEYGFKPYNSYEEMLGKEKIDCVLLCTPQMVRKEPIAFCVGKGIPVFTEKPPAQDLKTAKEINNIIEENKVTVSVGFVFRYLSMVNKAMELLKGRHILLLQLQYLCPMMYPDSRGKDFYYKRELSGGMIGDQAIHLLDLCRYVLQDEIDGVQAFGANIMQPKTKDITSEESAVMNMRSKKGTLISYLHTWTHRGWSMKMEIFAPDAKILLDLSSRKLTGVIDGLEISFAPQESQGHHFYELNEFIKYVKDGTGKILAPYSDSVKTMALVEGILKSIDDNGRPRRLKL